MSWIQVQIASSLFSRSKAAKRNSRTGPSTPIRTLGQAAIPGPIGWGTTGPDVKRGVNWTQQQCDERFTQDLGKFAQSVANVIGGAATTQHQFDALVSFAYNVGIGNLTKSTLLKLHKAGDYAGAANEFAKWNKAAGKVMAGLTRRRAAERALYTS